MRRDEIATFAAIALLFVLMAYAIISTARNVSLPPLSSFEERGERDGDRLGRPRIEDCDLPLWDRVRSLCDEED